MIRMFARHDVNDYSIWKQAYDAFETERREQGVRDDAVFLAADNRNNVTIWHDFDNLDAARAFAGSDRLRQVMQNAGVAGEPQIWFAERA